MSGKKSERKAPFKDIINIQTCNSIRHENIIALPYKSSLTKSYQTIVHCLNETKISGKISLPKRNYTENEENVTPIEIVIITDKSQCIFFPIYSNMSYGNCKKCSKDEIEATNIPKAIIRCEDKEDAFQIAISSMKMITQEGVCAFNKKYYQNIHLIK